jgi:alpha-tubulin suppressor-like RCC1 family protein
MLGCGEDDMATIGEEVTSELVDTNVTDSSQSYNAEKHTASAHLSTSSFVIKTDGTLWATGENSFGQLGLGNNVDVNSFTDTGVTGVKSVYTGLYHTFIIKTDGTLWATGLNSSGELGLGDNVRRYTFTYTGIANAKNVSIGTDFSFVIKTDGTLWATGKNDDGQLGLGDNIDVNVFTTTEVMDIRSVSCGGSHTIITKADGTLWSTGRNGDGQLGLGDNVDVNVFTDTGVLDVKKVSTGGSFSFIIKTDGTLWSTGGNGDGQLGLGDNTSRDEFTDTTLTNILFVNCGTSHTLIIKSDDTLWATGYNFYGQLGLGDTTARNSFTDTGKTNVSFVGCGLFHTIAIIGDILFATGHNHWGQLGLGDNVDVNVFTTTTETPGEYVEDNYATYHQGDIVQDGNYRYSVSLLSEESPSLYVSLTQIGAINSHKPFDGQNITPAISTSPMTYKIKGTEEFNAFTLAKVLATSITYKFRLSDTTLVKEETIAIDGKRDENGILSNYPTTVVYYADEQMPIDSTVEITLTNSEGNVELGDFILNNAIDSGFTNLTFSHGIIDYNDYTPDAWGNIPEAVKAIVTTFKVTLDFPLSNYDYAVSFNESISGKNVTIDASDSNGAVADGKTIFGALTRRVRVTSPSISSKVKDGKLDTMATLSLTVEEIV